MRDPIHPGETLREDLDALGMSAAELARRIEVPVNRITQILNGRRAVTGDTALRLGRFFGTSGGILAQSSEALRVAPRGTEKRRDDRSVADLGGRQEHARDGVNAGKHTARAWLYREQLRAILNRKQIEVARVVLDREPVGAPDHPRDAVMPERDAHHPAGRNLRRVIGGLQDLHRRGRRRQRHIHI